MSCMIHGRESSEARSGLPAVRVPGTVASSRRRDRASHLSRGRRHRRARSPPVHLQPVLGGRCTIPVASDGSAAVNGSRVGGREDPAPVCDAGRRADLRSRSPRTRVSHGVDTRRRRAGDEALDQSPPAQALGSGATGTGVPDRLMGSCRGAAAAARRSPAGCPGSHGTCSGRTGRKTGAFGPIAHSSLGNGTRAATASFRTATRGSLGRRPLAPA